MEYPGNGSSAEEFIKFGTDFVLDQKEEQQYANELKQSKEKKKIKKLKAQKSKSKNKKKVKNDEL